MAIGLIFEGPGVTQAQYEQVRDRVMPGNAPVPGLLYHAAGPSEQGWCVVEVWDSPEAAQRFRDTTLHQALADARISVQPRFFQVTNIMTP
jgi:hypothetical protein